MLTKEPYHFYGHLKEKGKLDKLNKLNFHEAFYFYVGLKRELIHGLLESLTFILPLSNVVREYYCCSQKLCRVKSSDLVYGYDPYALTRHT
jgi:hypothetical protein